MVSRLVVTLARDGEKDADNNNNNNNNNMVYHSTWFQWFTSVTKKCSPLHKKETVEEKSLHFL